MKYLIQYDAVKCCNSVEYTAVESNTLQEINLFAEQYSLPCQRLVDHGKYFCLFVIKILSNDQNQFSYPFSGNYRKLKNTIFTTFFPPFF